MEVLVGPLPSASVLAWVDFADAVLSGDVDAADASDAVPDDAMDAFAGYLTSWRSRALEDPVFTWSTDVPSDVAEYLVLAFFRLAERLSDAARERGATRSPGEGHEFYTMLVDRLLEALATEGPGSAEFAAHLRSFWPGL